MRYILSLFLFFSVTVQAQQSQMSHVVNGVTVYFSKADSAAITQQGIIELQQQLAQHISDSLDAVSEQVALDQLIITAQSAVDVKYSLLTAAQVRALLSLLLFNEGAINLTTLKVNPLSNWVH